MKVFRSLVIMLGVAGAATSARPQAKLETKAAHLNPSPYDMVPGWLKDVPQEWMHIVATYAESPNRIFVLQERHLGQSPRPERKPTQHYLVVVNREGQVTEEWSQWDSLFSDGHKVSIDPYDPEKHVWVLGRDVQQVMEFTNDGKQLVMALGTKGEAGSDDRHFNRPTDIAWFPDRSFVVSDGDTGRRIVKFDKHGKYLTSWSTEEGPLAGYHTTSVHGLAIDAKRRVYVAARNDTEGRIIVFDEQGTFLRQWTDLAPVQRVFISQDGLAWIQEGDNVNGVLAKYDLNGTRLATYVIPGTDMTVDAEGNLYSQNFQKGRNGVDKYVPKKGTKVGQWAAPRVGDKKYAAR